MFKKLASIVLVGISLMLGFTTSVLAALPEAVTDAIDGATADGQELGWALLGLAVIVGVIFWLKRKA